MALNPFPRADAAMTDGSGRPTRPWYLLLQSLNQTASTTGTQEEISAIATVLGSPDGSVANIPPLPEGSGKVKGIKSVAYVGQLPGIVQLSLVNDVSAPGKSYAYGTDNTGAKGWHAIADALSEAAGNTVLSVDAGGVTTIDLADVSLGTGGTLKLRTFDAKGRLSEEDDATTSDLAEGDNLYFTDARADARIPAGYIDGLQMQWVSGTALTVTSGAAYIQGAGTVLRAPSAIAKTGLSLSASTWYHVYLYSSSGSPAVEIVTTAPATPYNGTARSKTGDTSRRYVGSVLTDASGNLVKFLQTGNLVMYESSIAAAPFLVLSAGRATSVTNIACIGAVPVTAKIGVAIMATINATADAAIGNSDMVGTLSSSNYLQYVGNGVQTTHFMPLDGSQRFSYVMTASTATGGFFARVCGYYFER